MLSHALSLSVSVSRSLSPLHKHKHYFQCLWQASSAFVMFNRLQLVRWQHLTDNWCVFVYNDDDLWCFYLFESIIESNIVSSVQFHEIANLFLECVSKQNCELFSNIVFVMWTNSFEWSWFMCKENTQSAHSIRMNWINLETSVRNMT